jgi:inosine/xanthosine triphosphatase
MKTQKLTILVGSTSIHKVQAVQKVFEACYPAFEIIVNGVKATSNINEQPIGHEETIKGAQNRIKDAKNIYKDSWNFVVGIENGLIPISNEYYDVGWVVIEDSSGNISKSVSAGLLFENKYIDQSKATGFSTTVGTIVAEKLDCEATDPQFAMTNNHVPRTVMLEQALTIALGLYQFNNKNNG